MAHTSGSEAKVKYESAFFRWLEDQLLMVEDYVYEGAEFIGNPDQPLPAGTQWCDIGNKKLQDIYCFFHFVFYTFL